jgi:hypothetical protein
MTIVGYYCDPLSVDLIHNLHSTERGVDHALQHIAEFIEDSG